MAAARQRAFELDLAQRIESLVAAALGQDLLAAAEEPGIYYDPHFGAHSGVAQNDSDGNSVGSDKSDTNAILADDNEEQPGNGGNIFASKGCERKDKEVDNEANQIDTAEQRSTSASSFSFSCAAEQAGHPTINFWSVH